MYEPAYKKTLDHNYIVFPMPEDMDIDYQLNMISDNEIPGLIHMQPRYDQNGPQLYYEISSLQPLKRLYEHRTISDDDIRIILGSILNIYRSLQDYMLDDCHLLLQPEYIYVDAVSLKPALIFLPFYELERNNSLLKLSEYFMERSAHEGNDADMLSYRLYHLIRLDNFVTADIQRLLDEPHEAVKYPGPEIPYVKPAPVAAEVVHDETETLSDATSISEKKNFPLIPLITAASGLLILLIPASILHIPRSFRLGGMALFMTSLILLLFSLRKKTKVSPGNIKEKTDTTADETGEYDTYFSNTVSPLSDVSDDRLGRTVFIESDPKDIEGLLIEKNRKNEYPLTSFPFTIGKLKDRCELELNDRSVSRIHARILKKDDQYYLQDCGSTNGTFLNGIQLQAEETVPIEKDDEIGIGRVRFVLA